MHQIVVNSETRGVDILSSIQDILAGGSCTNHTADAVEGFDCHLIHPLVRWCGWCTNGEWAKNLSGVTVIVGADLGDKHISFLEDTIGLVLCRDADSGIGHGCGSHI